MNDTPLSPVCQWGEYTFSTWPISQVFDGFPGVYVYSLYIDGKHQAVYIGESEDVGHRMNRHREKKYYPVQQFHHIHCLPVRDGEKTRKHIKKTLIAVYNPPLNIWHRTGPAAPEITCIFPDRWTPDAATGTEDADDDDQ